MKYVPTPETSVCAALIELKRLETEWQDQRTEDEAMLAAAQARARCERERRERELKAKAQRAIGRQQRREQRRRELTDRYESIKIAEVRARAEADARARVEAARLEIEAQLRPRRGRFVAACLAGLALLGVTGLAVDGYYDQQEAQYLRARSDHAAFMDRLDAQRADVAALRAGWGELAAHQAELRARRAALLESIAADAEESVDEKPGPGASESEAEAKPKPSRPTAKPKPKPKPESTTRPPIVLNPDGDPLAGLD